MGGQREFEELFQVCEACAEVLPVLLSGFNECRKFLELLSADRGLGVERFEVVAQMAVNVFVVETFREFAELPAEAFATGVVFS